MSTPAVTGKFCRPPVGIIDAHCHLADPRWLADIPAIIERAQDDGVVGFFVCGTGPEDWADVRQLASQYPGVIFPSYGIHPYWVAVHSDAECRHALTRLQEYQAAGLAIGEIGLDFRPQWSKSGGFERQDIAFRAQLQLAVETDKPVVIHSVRAHHRVLEVLKELGAPPREFVVHGYVQGPEVAEQYVAKGGVLSIGTGLLRGSSQRLEQALRDTPLTQLLVESDGPDQKLVTTPGSWNPPSSCIAIIHRLASIKGIEVDECTTQLHDNLCRIFQREWSP